MKQPLRKQIHVADPGLFRDLIRVVASQYQTQSKAADALGLARGHLNRLHGGTIGASISTKLFHRLEDVLPGERVPDLTRALLTPNAAKRLLDYEEQLSTQLGRYGLRHMAVVGRRAFLTPPLRRFLNSTLPDAPFDIDIPQNPALTATLRSIQAHSQYRDLLHDFLRTAHRRGHGTFQHGCVMLAIVRVIEPIVPSAGGIDLDWKDLHEAGKLAKYLKSALANEKLLLDREPDLQRAQQLAAGVKSKKRR